MIEAVKSKWENRTVVILFVLISIGFLISGFSGSAWQILSMSDFNFYLVILSITLSVTAGALLTYSIISFFQIHEVKHLMFLVMSANIIIWIVLYLLTHPSSADWSTYFADRDRNRTLAMALVLIVIPTILLGSFTGEMKPSRPSVFLLILWGAVFLPIFSIFLFFSEDALFIIVTHEGGIQGLTEIGIFISMAYLISQIIALLWMIYKWRKARTATNLSLMLAVALWIIGTIFIIILWNPLQVAELLWIISIIAGFLLIAISQFMTAIIHPHRFLEKQVQQRTRELNQSIREGDLLRKMWTHKMGNLLQGLITYLDILEHAAQNSEDDSNTRIAARNLSREATLVNLQVSQLTRIKEHIRDAIYPVNVVPLLEEAVESAKQIIGEDNFSVESDWPEGYSVIADGFLPLVFQSLFSFHAKRKIENTIKFTITLNTEKHHQVISIVSDGEEIPPDLRKFIESEQDIETISLDLNLFTAKLLLSRYNATVKCGRNEATSENSCTLIFPSN